MFTLVWGEASLAAPAWLREREALSMSGGGGRRAGATGVGDNGRMAIVTAVLHRGVVDSDEPILCADDLGVLRGDGVFETINVREGRAFLLDAHLDRMSNSARRMEFELPDKAELAGLAEQALAAWRERESGEGRCGWSRPAGASTAGRPPSTRRSIRCRASGSCRGGTD
ncbi:hypothetical protein GCM10029992_11440 [Glycomyces albus]